MKPNYNLTKMSCFGGIFLQAVCINIIAILFVPLQTIYGLEYKILGALLAVCFGVQMVADVVCSLIADRIGYKKLLLFSSVFSGCGLLMFAMTHFLSGNNVVFLFVAVILMAMSGGVAEVVISPLADSIPVKNKDGFMALVHAGYAWGQVITIVLTTLALFLLGTARWHVIVLAWSVIAIAVFFIFLFARYPAVKREKGAELRIERKALIKSPFYIFCLLMITVSAASEIILNQWASTFTEKALRVDKLTGDLLGMCGFAVMMGIGRTWYGIFGGKKMPITKFLTVCSVLAFLCYIGVALSPMVGSMIFCVLCGLFVSMLWPGILVAATGHFQKGGAFLFGVLAIFGDLGAGAGPLFTGLLVDFSEKIALTGWISSLHGITAEQAGIRAAILISAVFPLLAFVCGLVLVKLSKKKAVLATQSLIIPDS